MKEKKKIEEEEKTGKENRRRSIRRRIGERTWGGGAGEVGRRVRLEGGGGRRRGRPFTNIKGENNEQTCVGQTELQVCFRHHSSFHSVFFICLFRGAELQIAYEFVMI